MAIVEGPLKQVLFLHMDAPNEPIPDGFAVCDGSTLGPTQQDIVPGGSYTLPNFLNAFLLGADPTKAVFTPAASVGDSHVNLPAGAPGPGGTGGTHAYSLSINELPSHSHNGSTTGTPTVTLTDPGHTHTITDPGHTHIVSDPGHTHSGTSDTVGAHQHTLHDPGHVHTTTAVELAGDYWYPNGNVSKPVPGNNAYSGSTPTINASTTGLTMDATGAHSHNISITGSQTGITVGSHATGITVQSASSNIQGTISGLNIGVGNTGGGNAFDNRPRYIGVVPIMRVKS